MDVQAWTIVILGLTFSLFIGVAIRSRAGSTSEFHVAGGGMSSRTLERMRLCINKIVS